MKVSNGDTVRTTLGNPPFEFLYGDHIFQTKTSGPESGSSKTETVFTFSGLRNQKKHMKKLQKGGNWLGARGIKNPWIVYKFVRFQGHWDGQKKCTQKTHSAKPAPCVPDHYPHRAPDIMSVLRMLTSSASSLFHILAAEMQNLPHQSHHPIRNIPPGKIDAYH